MERHPEARLSSGRTRYLRSAAGRFPTEWCQDPTRGHAIDVQLMIGYREQAASGAGVFDRVGPLSRQVVMRAPAAFPAWSATGPSGRRTLAQEAAGNTAVLKPSGLCPGSRRLITSLLSTADANRAFSRVMQAECPSGTDLPGLDFVHLARGLGCPAERSEQVGDLDEALASGGPRLVEVAVDQAVSSLSHGRPEYKAETAEMAQ